MLWCTIAHVLYNTTLGGAILVMAGADLYIYCKNFPTDGSKVSCSNKLAREDLFLTM